MITRSHQSDTATSTAQYSPCETYRYALTRTWDPQGRKLAYIMLNPSKATEMHNDPTVERCERRARALGFGAFRVVNLFALRETDPHKLRKHSTPDGPENTAAIQDACAWADQILAGWGVHGTHLDRGKEMQTILTDSGREIHCLGLTKHGHPRHPLYIAYAQRPALWLAQK